MLRLRELAKVGQVQGRACTALGELHQPLARPACRGLLGLLCRTLDCRFLLRSQPKGERECWGATSFRSGHTLRYKSAKSPAKGLEKLAWGGGDAGDPRLHAIGRARAERRGVGD